jgi:hypothetical protein
VTDSTTNPALDQLPPNVQISFRDDLDIEAHPELRRTVERSVTTQLARMQEAVAQVRAAQAERAQLEEALNAPLMKLIEEDPVASKTLEDLRSGQLIDVDSTMELSAEQPRAATNADVDGPLEGLEASQAQFRASEFRLPPFDFDWSWFNTGGILPTANVLTKQAA